MKRNIFFSRAPKDGVSTGREMLSGLLWRVFNECVEGACRIDSPWQAQSPLKALLRGVRCWLDGLDRALVDECISSFGDCSGTLFIDGSNYGRLAEDAKRRLPNATVITFFHNVEARFFWDGFLESRSPRSLIVAFCNYLAERKAVANSDVLVFLNARDADLARRIYRRSMGSPRIEILPMCLEDRPEALETVTVAPTQPIFGLFVGGSFFANVQGMKWFAENVAPFLPCMTYVVGKGFEAYREELEGHDNITVVGTVESVYDWYARAAFVISPIFHGSGMKTKTAEAAQFGRPLLGTSEAFTGFEKHIEVLGLECTTPKDFIDGIAGIVNGGLRFDAMEIRSVFVDNYSQDAARRRMCALL